jgi:hypothetical protein
MTVRKSPPPSSVAQSNIAVSMTQDHFRWLLMWHAAMVRSLMLLEIDTHGLHRARRNTRVLERQRQAFIAKHWPEMKMLSKRSIGNVAAARPG